MSSHAGQKDAWIRIIHVQNGGLSRLFLLQKFAEAVHHHALVLHEAVDVAVEGDGGRLVSEEFGEGLDVHAALDGAGGKSVPKGVEPAVGEMQFFLQKFKRSLIGADGDGFLPADDKISL